MSGGGARGYAHLGVLQYLEEQQIKPHAISGTSAGAIVGALYGAGLSPQRILAIMTQNKYFGWSSILWGKSGFFSMDVLAKVLAEAIGKDDFEALQLKLFVAATDFNRGESVIFSKGPLFRPIIASASIPVVFEPVVIDDRVLIDGGLLNNFPLEPLEGICEVIIGSHVNNLKGSQTDNLKLQPFHISERCFHMAIAPAIYEKAKRCDVFLDPPMLQYNMFDTKKGNEIFEAGYQAAKAQHDTILKAVFG